MSGAPVMGMGGDRDFAAFWNDAIGNPLCTTFLPFWQ